MVRLMWRLLMVVRVSDRRRWMVMLVSSFGDSLGCVDLLVGYMASGYLGCRLMKKFCLTWWGAFRAPCHLILRKITNKIPCATTVSVSAVSSVVRVKCICEELVLAVEILVLI